jgi:hypothetical protein
MGKIVLSYRRDDAKTITNWLYEKLVDRYGGESVFRDIDSIQPTENFKKRIGRALKDCDFVIAVIGPAWHGPQPDGQSRINATNDWVRIEIETALQLDIPLLPVLVEDAEMPDPETLPSSLREVTEINALPISSGGAHFYDDLNKLFATIETVAGIAAATKAAGPAQPAATRTPGATKERPTEYRPDPVTPTPPRPSPSSQPAAEDYPVDPGAATAGFGPKYYVPPPRMSRSDGAWRPLEGRTIVTLFVAPAIVMTILWLWAFATIFRNATGAEPLFVFLAAGLFMAGLGLLIKRKAKLGFLWAVLAGVFAGGIVLVTVISGGYLVNDNDITMGFVVFLLGGAAATVAGFALASIRWRSNAPLP